MAAKTMQLEDWLDDLCVRFIINLPQEDLSSVARICFQVEEAQWFYEDFIRPLDPALPSLTLRTFCLRIFQHCPLLASFSVENHTKAFEEFLEYKTRVPVRGAIMLNHAMDSVVLVKGWKKGANWSFPRGKINKDEDDLDCAVREVYEETGLDLREVGLVPTEGKPKYIEIPMREQHLRLYVFRDVPMDTNFQPRTRKEISKIQWYKLSELPTLRKKGSQPNHHYDSGLGTNANKFYMVAPFLVQLKKWIVSQKKMDEKRAFSSGSQTNALHQHLPIEEEPTEDETWAPDAASQVPPIESLDGATRELQRLLNIPSPAQSAQPSSAAALGDKGSALLSILQQPHSAGVAAAQQRMPQPESQMPHTPLSFPAVEPGQPRNPHHHTNNVPQGPPNMHQPPPPTFTVPPNQVPAGWNPLQNQDQSQTGVAPPNSYPGYPGYAIPSQYPGYAGGQQQNYNYTTNPNNLAHPQSLHPQVPSQAFNTSALQEGLAQAIQAIQAVGPASYQAAGPQPVYGQPAPMPPQVHVSPNNPRAMPLNGQSLSLLNALRQEAVPPTSTEPKEIAEGQRIATSPYVQYASSYGQNPTQQIPPTNIMGHPPQPKSPTELAGSAVGPPASDHHRSALLDIFKKPVPDAAPNQPKGAAGTQGPANGTVGAAPKPGKTLLAQLQTTIPVNNTRPVATSGQTTKAYPNVQPDMLPVDRMTTKKRSNQPSKPAGGAADPKSTRNKVSSASRTAKASPIQPTRILQRGQTLQQFSPTEKPQSPGILVHDPAGQPHASQAVNAPPPQRLPPAPSPGIPNYRPDVSQEKKRQLLSLFGTSSGSAASGMIREPSHAGSARGGTPRPLVASMASAEAQAGFRNASPSRAGNETPISPADHTFLLDYLQSVTNNAGR